jgi:hypothetical protein
MDFARSSGRAEAEGLAIGHVNVKHPDETDENAGTQLLRNHAGKVRREDQWDHYSARIGGLAATDFNGCVAPARR